MLFAHQLNGYSEIWPKRKASYLYGELRYKENPLSNKTKHCHLKKLATIVYIYNISQLSLLLVTTEFQLFQPKKKKTNATGGVMSCIF